MSPSGINQPSGEQPPRTPVDHVDVMDLDLDLDNFFRLASLPASADPSQPLYESLVRSAALARIASDALVLRAVRNGRRRPGGAPSSAARLRAMIEASDQEQAEADKAAAICRVLSASPAMSAVPAEIASDAPVSRAVSNERRPASDLSLAARPSRAPVPLPARNAGLVSGSSSAATGKKASRSPAELEMLRLKDRRTLHSLAP